MASNTTLPPLQKGISDKTHMKRHQGSQPHDHASVETDIDIPPKKEYYRDHAYYDRSAAYYASHFPATSYTAPTPASPWFNS